MERQNNVQPLTIQFGRELDLVLAKLVTKGILFAAAVSIVVLVQMLMHEITNRHLFLLTGALLSGLALFGYVLVIMRDAEAGTPRKSFVSMLVGFGGFVPYLFGGYLLFYEGLWRLRSLFDQVSVTTIVTAFFYILAGYIIIVAIYRVAEFGRGIDEGRILIRKTT